MLSGNTISAFFAGQNNLSSKAVHTADQPYYLIVVRLVLFAGKVVSLRLKCVSCMYKPINIDRKNLTLMGVVFPNLEMLNSTASAIGSNMYEGFEPTVNRIALIRDYALNKITFEQFVQASKDRVHAE